MALQEYLAKRWLHTVLVTVLAGVIIAPAFLDFFPELSRPVLGLAPVLAWSLGVNYERSLVLVEKLVDEDELRAAEQRRSSIWRN
ncbi:MAG: hypothetical protein ABEH77_02615 [Halobacteriaceae archaeon]